MINSGKLQSLTNRPNTQFCCDDACHFIHTSNLICVTDFKPSFNSDNEIRLKSRAQWVSVLSQDPKVVGLIQDAEGLHGIHKLPNDILTPICI